MSDATLKIKNRNNEEMAARREYGSPLRRGFKTRNSDFKVEYNTDYSDWNSWYDHDLDDQKQFYNDNLRDLIDCSYIEFLQDRFYRIYKGYPVTYWELPIGNKKRMELYNQVALDCGHPEYMVDTTTGKPLEIHSAEKIEDKQQAAAEPPKSKDKGVVDVLDSDGNVVAENVGSVDNQPEQKKSGKKEHKDPADVIYAKDKSAKSVEPEKEQTAEPAAAKLEEKHGLAQAVMFHEVGINGANCWVDEERGREFADNNAEFVKLYPDLQKLVDLCKSYAFLVKFYNLQGLVRADLYAKGIQGCYRALIIDPAKIRNQYSILITNVDQLSDPFNTTLVSFDEPYFQTVAIGDPIPDVIADSSTKTSVNLPFYKYISYNAFENDEIALAAANTFELCNRMFNAGLNIRFKVFEKVSANDFWVGLPKNPGLGKFVNNKPWLGLKVHIKVDNGVITTEVGGNHAKEFIKLIGNDICNPAPEPEGKKGSDKKDSKNKRTIEKPVGRG